MPVGNRLVTAEEFEQMPEEPGVRMELVRWQRTSTGKAWARF